MRSSSYIKSNILTQENKMPYKLMKYIQLYLIFTVVFYFIGPMQWKTRNTLFTFTLVAIFQMMLYMGYHFGMTGQVKKRQNALCSDIFVIKHFNTFAIITMIINFLYLLRITFLISRNGLWDVIITSLTDPSVAYKAANSITASSNEMFGGKILSVIIAFAGLLTVALIPLTIVYFKRLKMSSKVLAIISIVIQIILSISTGRSEGFFTLGIYVLAAFLLKKRKKRIQKARTYVGIILIIVLLLVLYSNLMINRTHGTYSLTLGGNIVDTNVTLLKVLPKSMEPLVVYLDIYLTQGYYGMSLATTCSWNPTYGLGSSAYLRNNIEELFNVDLTTHSYLGQAEQYDWGASANWHTVYTWLANDFHWIGVAIIMFLLGILLARIYRDAYINQNPIAIAMFAVLILFVFFIPANNRVFAQAETFFAFWFYLLVWLIAPYIKTKTNSSTVDNNLTPKSKYIKY